MSGRRRRYREARVSWNRGGGCDFDCEYCYPSFRKQAKRQKQRCLDCYYYRPHFHPERLTPEYTKKLPKTRPGEFIFTVDMGDWFWLKPEWRRAILECIEKMPDRDFLIQSKGPSCFHEDDFPENVILGTTVETNRDDLTREISKAPPPSERIRAMIELKHPRKMITIEPILDFDLDEFARMIVSVKPWRVYVGYDSHPDKNRLREPPLSKTKKLIKRLAWPFRGIAVKDEEIVSDARFGRVYCKWIRKVWWKAKP